jgi:hypothetical protein
MASRRTLTTRRKRKRRGRSGKIVPGEWGPDSMAVWVCVCDVVVCGVPHPPKPDQAGTAVNYATPIGTDRGVGSARVAWL